MLNTSYLLTRLSFLALLLGCSSAAYGATTTVYPTGVNATDINNVQNAVNAGGTVLLKATNAAGQATAFNFGIWPDNTSAIPAGSSVTLNASVTITGETVKGNHTTINGGVTPFYESIAAAKVSISNLYFTNPQCDAITIWRSAGITISNCDVSWPTPYLNVGGYTETLGIFVGGAGNATITGPVNITGNYVHGLAGTPYEFGIQVNGVESAINITGNTVSVGYALDPNSGSYDSEGIAAYSCNGAVNISGNNVQVGPGVTDNAITVQGPATGSVTILGNQISIAQAATCYAGIEVDGSLGTVNIDANAITSQCPSANGIALEGNPDNGSLANATVALNLINVQGSDVGAIELYGAVSKSTVALNLITGNAAYELAATVDWNTSDVCGPNSFLLNLPFGFSASAATIFLDVNTANFTVASPYVSVINNGTNNKIAQ